MRIRVSAWRWKRAPAWGVAGVTRALEQLIEERGRPESLRLDNGARVLLTTQLGWADEWKIELVLQPGRPMQNGHEESFHGRLRDECLNAHRFRTLDDVRSTLLIWREEYNCERPHSSRLPNTTGVPTDTGQRAGHGPARCQTTTIKPTENLQL